ncbi:MAG TPA: LacI family DNA-binding transcriptional regulator [Acetobacteraceae bacterium]|nr:LacI family DNA-binding transcriptional regulator [Acetobacteraceae bacterium]
MASRPNGARIRDVAAAAEVSPAAVSRYLNGLLNLPRETAERIDRAVHRLDYRPNPHARRLILGRSETVGLVLPDIANPFFARLAAAIEAAADHAGLGLVLSATLNRPGRELEYIERMRRNHVDGLIFVTNHPDDGTLRRALNATPGAILIDEDVPGAIVPKVFCDNEEGGFLAGRHLLAAGHRRIAFVGGPRGLMSTQERRAGLDRALAAKPDAAVVWESFGPYTLAEGARVGAALLARKPRPSAIFAGSDELVLGLLPVLREARARVPDDMSIVGFDDVGPLHLLDPPVSAIRQPVDAIGERAVALLTAVPDDPPPCERLPVRLVERGSVAAPHILPSRAFSRTGRQKP